jgi:hypothetical protein
MRWSLVVSAGVFVAALAPIAPAGATVTLPEPIVVPVSEALDVVADQATHQVFVSTGQHDSVDVFDWAGNAVDSLTSIDNASFMAMDSTSGTVFVSEPQSSKIAAIDTATLDVTHYSVSTTPCPTSLSFMDGLLYYGFSGSGCGSSGGIGVLDPQSATPQGALLVNNGAYSPLIGAADGTIVMAEAGISPTNPRSYSVTDAGATQIAYRWNTGSNAQDVAISPGGEEVIVASGAPYEHQALNPKTLETLYTYPSSAYPTAAAYSSDGALVATGTASSDDDVRLFVRGQTQLVKSWNLDVAAIDASLVAGGLAFGGKTHLFAIAKDYPSSYYLTIFQFDVRADSTLTVDAPDSTVGNTIQVTGSLSGVDNGVETPLEGEEVTITRTRDGVNTPLGTATVAEDGSFTIDDTPTQGGVQQYTATWPGNATYVPATARTTTDVAYLGSTVGLELDDTKYLSGSDATVTVTLAHDDQTEGSVTLSLVDFKGTHEIATGSFDETGTFQTTVPVLRSGYFIAQYVGSDTHEPATSPEAAFGVKATTTATVDGYFRRDGDVWLVRPDVNPKITWTVQPRPVAYDCAQLVLQTHTTAGWRKLRHSACRDVVGSASVSWLLKDGRTGGTQWRARLVTDETPTHLAIQSPWTYITFRGLPTA